MRKNRKILSVFLFLVALLVMLIPISEAGATSSASDFKIIGSKLVSYSGSANTVTIPVDIVTIGKSSFENNNYIEKISMPKMVTKIEPYAFWNCNRLSDIGLGQGLDAVDDFAFTNCKGLRSVTIPDNIKSIGIQAFADCVNLTDITIPPEVTFIHDTAFDGCTKLVIHYIEGTYAEKYAEMFYLKQQDMAEYEDVNLVPVIPELPKDEIPVVKEPIKTTPTVVIAEDSILNQNHITSAHVVTDDDSRVLGTSYVVGNEAFVSWKDNASVFNGNDSNVNDSNVNDSNVNDSNVNDLNHIEDINTAVDIGLLDDLSTIPKYRIVDDLFIADQAFYNHGELSNYTIHSDIEEIGEFSFARSGLKQILVPDSVKKIGYGAFYHCDLLEDVKLSSSIQVVEPKAFQFTKWMKDFYDNESDDYLISGGVLVAYKGKAENIVLPNNVRVIAAQAFENHSEMKSIICNEGLISIGEEAFLGCNQLEEISVSTSLQEIRDRAFRDTKLKQISLPVNFKTLGYCVFPTDCSIDFLGGVPDSSVEATTKRLSNEHYRLKIGTDDKQIKDAVIEVESEFEVQAYLEGMNQAYHLSMQSLLECNEIQRAFQRNMSDEKTERLYSFYLDLKDDSNISILKLGKQNLKITMVLPEDLYNQKLKCFVLDRNGQPDAVPCKKVKWKNKVALEFSLKKLGYLAIYSSGNDEDDEILEEAVSFQTLSKPVNDSAINNTLRLKCIIIFILLSIATIRLLPKRRH